MPKELEIICNILVLGCLEKKENEQIDFRELNTDSNHFHY